MFEELIFSEKDIIQNCLEDNQYYKLIDIINDNNLPQYLRYYIRGYLSEHLFKLKTDIIDNHGIQVDDLEFSDNWRMFEEACYNFYKINKNKLEEIILSAIQLNFNLQIRPKQTLVNFLFRDEIYQISQIINNRLNFFDPELEIISELRIWLSEQPQVVSIHHFRNATQSLLTEFFKENHFNKVADWFLYLTKTIEGTKFNPEHSIYAILSIFANDLNWNGLQQYLNEHKQQFANRALTKNLINDVLVGYLVYWHGKGEVTTIDVEQTEPIDQIDSIQEINDFDISKIEKVEEVASENDELAKIDEFTEIDEFDKMLLEQEFLGEGETYDIQSKEKDEIESTENTWSFSDDETQPQKVPINEDLENLDEILAEVNLQNQSFSSEIDQFKASEAISEDEELEKLAEMLGSRTDISPLKPTEQEPTISEPATDTNETASIEYLIDNLTNKLERKIANRVEIKSYEELANQVRLQDLSYIDLNDPQLPPTKRELYQLLLDLKRK